HFLAISEENCGLDRIAYGVGVDAGVIGECIERLAMRLPYERGTNEQRAARQHDDAQANRSTAQTHTPQTSELPLADMTSAHKLRCTRHRHTDIWCIGRHARSAYAADSESGGVE